MAHRADVCPSNNASAIRQARTKKGLMLQRLLLENSEKVIKTLIDRAKKGDRAALALCVERLIPRLKGAAELPEDSVLSTKQDTEKRDYSALTNEELEELDRLLAKAEAAHSGSDRSRAPAPKAA